MPSPSNLRLKAVIHALSGGGVIACPTEAVWGLSCDPADKQAVSRLLALKDRPVEKGLILVAASREQVDFLLEDLSDEQLKALQSTWPGPATWLVPHRQRVPYWVRGKHDTVAVRVSDHPTLRALCQAWGGPLVSTSANPAGARPATAAFQVRRYFGDRLDGMLPGELGAQRRPTTIRDLASGDVIRD